MSKDKQISIVSSEDGDWQGIYIDGKLEYEGHSIRYWDVFEVLGIKFTEKNVGNEWLENQCRLPKEEKKCEFIDE
jgi:hypothetical protein